MNCTLNIGTIGDYLDGTLGGDQAVAFEAHLAACARCQSIAADFRRIRTAARSLEPAVPPARVWARLASALDEERESSSGHAWLGGLLTWQPIASAAVILLAVSGLWWVGGQLARQPGQSADVARTTASPTAGVEPDGPVDAELRLAEVQYAAAIASLAEVADARASGLEDDAGDALRASVEAINEAIGESRAALEGEPNSQLAQDSLFEALRSKVTLLHDTVALVNELRLADEDPFGAVGPGVNQ